MADRVYLSQEELLEHAKTLLNNSLRDLYGNKSIQEFSQTNKGEFGQLVERLHYGIDNNSESRPDVAGHINIEIKASPVKIVFKGTQISPDQRTTLSMIDYDKICTEQFEHSQFIQKNKRILLNLFLLGPENIYDQKFLFIDLIEPSKEDWRIIKEDWEIIKQKVKSGNADNLSQSDTKYLCAATKGSKNQKPKPYMKGKYKAKKRSYSYKAAYIKHYLKRYELKKNSSGDYFLKPKSIDSIQLIDISQKVTLEEVVLERFKPYVGKSDLQIALSFKEESMFIRNTDNARWHWNTSLILTGKKKKNISDHIDEFSKTGLTVKTVRVNQSGKLCQLVSFKTQGYESITTNEWERSSLYEEMSRPFLWIVYVEDEKNQFKLRKVFFWKMPSIDLDFVQNKWRELKRLIEAKDYRHQYFQDVESFYFLKIKDSVGGRNKKIGDKKVTNLSHWFRKNYVEEIINSH